MRTVRDIMVLHNASVTRETPVHAAVVLMRTHGLLVAPVVEDGEIVGVIDAASLFMYQPDVLVADIMAAPVSVSSDDGLSTVAALMRAHGLTELPVRAGDSFGSVRASDLLDVWAMPVDSLTGLPWQDSFRLRSAAELASGKELTLLFFDMDDFGSLNKRFGHVVGDRALKAVAGYIRDSLNPETDQAARFGGDEFVVSTSRHRNEAIQWAAAVRQKVVELEIEGLDGSVGVSIGIAGGLRQGERPGTHGPSTLDDLINLASQASTEAKYTTTHLMSLDHDLYTPSENGKSPAQGTPHGPRFNRIRIRNVEAEIEDGRVRAKVTMEHGGASFTAVKEGSTSDVYLIVAVAAAQALGHFLPAAYAVRPTAVRELSVDRNGNVMMAVVSMEGPHGRQSLVGVSDVAANAHHAVAKALLDAVNRPLEAIPLLDDAASSAANTDAYASH